MSLLARVNVTLPLFRLDVTLQVDPASVVALMGPNGAGKTTLLRALAGLIPLEAGRVSLGGRVLADTERRTQVPTCDRRVAMVFQDHRLFPHLTALDNVAFGLRAAGAKRATARALAAGHLAALGLSAEVGARPHELSGGQSQRVALARALATSPEALLLDEPLSALDVVTRSSVRAALSGRLAGFPGPVLLVTHDLAEAVALADRIVVVEEGAVVQRGTPTEVVARPATPYVAQLAGTNVFFGTAADGVLTVDAGGRLPVPAGVRGRTAVAVPPGAVTLHPRPPASAGGAFYPGTLLSLEGRGPQVRATVAGDLSFLADVPLATLARDRWREGQEVWVSVAREALDAYPA